MTTASPTRPRAFAVWFKDLERWDTTFFRGITWSWPKEYFVTIASLLEAKAISVDPTLPDCDKPIIDKISFGGEIFITAPDARMYYKGRLFWANSGDFIYSKIRVKQGSCSIVPATIPAVAVSAEYPVYKIISNKVLPEYFSLLVRCQPFLKILDGLSHGSSTKTRIHPSQFELISIPIPPLSTQQVIVDRWQQAQSDIETTHLQSDNLELQRKHNFLAALGDAGHAPADKQRCFALPWENVERWSIEYLQRACFGEASFKWRYPSERLSDLCKGQSGGTPLTSNPRLWDGTIPWVSPKDMKVFRISDAQDHISEEAVKSSAAPMIPAKSVLLVVRSGILQRLVPVAINEISVSINQDIRAFTVTDERLLPEFLAYFLEARSNDLLSLVKWSTTVQSINREELEAYHIPLPPILTQQRIVEASEKMRDDVNKKRAAAKLHTENTKADIEAMILGTKQVDLV
jgi:type I restriction enzyme S subunit